MTVGHIQRLMLVGLFAAGCQGGTTTGLERRADYFRDLGMGCSDPRLDEGYAFLGARQVKCQGEVSGVPMFVTIDADSEHEPLVSASIPQASGRRAAVEAWSSIVLPMPGLELLRADLARALEEWAGGGSASISVPGGLAWVGTGEDGQWTFSVDPDQVRL